VTLRFVSLFCMADFNFFNEIGGRVAPLIEKKTNLNNFVPVFSYRMQILHKFSVTHLHFVAVSRRF
jgi:hypothetical protein